MISQKQPLRRNPFHRRFGAVEAVEDAGKADLHRFNRQQPIPSQPLALRHLSRSQSGIEARGGGGQIERIGAIAPPPVSGKLSGLPCVTSRINPNGWKPFAYTSPRGQPRPTRGNMWKTLIWAQLLRRPRRGCEPNPRHPAGIA